MSEKDVHTEHCCIVHGCKYGDDDCTVTTRQRLQSYLCEDCSEEAGVEKLGRIADLEAENARLRDALRWIFDRMPATQDFTLAHEMGEAARAALSQDTPHGPR